MQHVVRTRNRQTAPRHERAILGVALLTLWFGGQAAAEAAKTPNAEEVGGAPADELQRVRARGPGTFWVRPGVDLRAYDRVVLLPIRVAYKDDPRHHRLRHSSAGVLFTDRDLGRLQRAFYEAFKTGFSSGEGFGPTSRPDPGLLWVSTSLIDVVVRNNQTPVTNELAFVQNFGEMTLRVEFSDGETGETLARFEERRTIGPSKDFISRLYRVDYYSYWRAVRANLARWSEIVRRRMHDQRVGAAQF